MHKSTRGRLGVSRQSAHRSEPISLQAGEGAAGRGHLDSARHSRQDTSQGTSQRIDKHALLPLGVRRKQPPPPPPLLPTIGCAVKCQLPVLVAALIRAREGRRYSTGFSLAHSNGMTMTVDHKAAAQSILRAGAVMSI